MPSSSARGSTALKVSEVWKHFTKESATLARCNLCPKSYNCHSSTRRFWEHLMYSHEDVYESTNYYKIGLVTGNVLRTKHKSLNSQQSAGDPQPASDVTDSADAQDMAPADAGSGWDDAPAPNEMASDASPVPDDTDASAPEPVATPQFPLDMMLLLQAQLMQQALYQPPAAPLAQPIPVRMPPAQAPENDVFESSGRAMLLRLRQLYEKDAKLFLRVQNEISNVIFKHEVKEL